MLMIFDGLACVNDRSVAGLELGIVVQGFADGLTFLDGVVNAFDGFGETGFERSLESSRFGDERGNLLVTGDSQGNSSSIRIHCSSESCLRPSVLDAMTYPLAEGKHAGANRGHALPSENINMQSTGQSVQYL